MLGPNTKILNLPPLEKSLLRRCLIGLRSYRKSGIRIEKEIIEGKNIFHNYGHGASGISMAPGTAIEISNLVDKEGIKGQPIAILGSGIAGLTTAL